MAFGIESEGFWGKKELSYQHVHMFWSFWISYLLYNIIPFGWVPFVCGLLCGMAMESYQHYKFMIAIKMFRSWTDSIRDLCFWIIGGCLNYIIIFMR